MKLGKLAVATLIAAALCVVGCSKHGSGSSSVDTAPLEKISQSSSDAPTKSAVDNTVSEIKSANYTAALTDLGKLTQNPTLTPQQRQDIQDLYVQVQKAAAAAAK